MEKYLYFRVGTATASEDDEATGSNLYPVSHFMGAVSGTSDADGAITDDDNAISLFFVSIASQFILATFVILLMTSTLLLCV